MAISVDPLTHIITVPKADTQLVTLTPFEVRQLDLDAFRLDLKDWEDSEEGIIQTKTHSHNTTVSVGGVTLARVIEILDPYTITFENGSYAVNLAGANSNVADRTNLNSVQIRSANSAGLTFSKEIQDQSFLNGNVYINTVGRGLPGTQYPRGTVTRPVDNYANAKVIGDARNLNGFHLDGTIVLGAEPVMTTNWIGESPISSIIVFTGQDTDSMTMQRIGIAGTMSPVTTSLRSSVYQSVLSTITNFYGIAVQSALFGEISIYNNSTTNEEIVFDSCFSVAGGTTPTLNINGMPSSVEVRHYSGGLRVTNATHADFHGYFDGQGRLEIDSTCTDGEIVVGGEWELIDNSGPGCIVITGSNVTDLIQSGTGVWTEQEKNDLISESLDTNTYVKKSSDAAEQANLKL